MSDRAQRVAPQVTAQGGERVMDAHLAEFRVPYVDGDGDRVNFTAKAFRNAARWADDNPAAAVLAAWVHYDDDNEWVLTLVVQ